MKESIPPADEFYHFTMGMGLINSHTKDRMSRELFDRLKNSPVYKFLIKNLNFKVALDAFCSRPYVLENKLHDELQDQGLYKEHVTMSLMDILAKNAAAYLTEAFCPEYNVIVVKTGERIKYANVLREVLEFSNERLLDLPEAEYMQLERTAALFLNALRDDEFCAYPQTLRGTNLISEKRFVCGVYRSFYTAYDDSQPNIVMNLAQIILGEFNEHTMNKWLKSERGLCSKKEAINSASRRANKENDKYFR